MPKALFCLFFMLCAVQFAQAALWQRAVKKHSSFHCCTKGSFSSHTAQWWRLPWGIPQGDGDCLGMWTPYQATKEQPMPLRYFFSDCLPAPFLAFARLYFSSITWTSIWLNIGRSFIHTCMPLFVHLLNKNALKGSFRPDPLLCSDNRKVEINDF